MTTPQQALDGLERLLGEADSHLELTEETSDAITEADVRRLRADITQALATLRKALEPGRFRVSVGDHHAEIQVSQTAPTAYHQGMVETVVAEAMRRALASRAPLRWTREIDILRYLLRDAATRGMNMGAAYVHEKRDATWWKGMEEKIPQWVLEEAVEEGKITLAEPLGRAPGGEP
jgi:hypothetical protein